MNCSMPGFPVLHPSWRMLKFMFIESVMLSNHLIFCRPLLLLPSIFPRIRVFSSESALPIRWPRYWSFCFSICPSNEYSRLVSFRMDWFDLLAVQGTLKSLHQNHNCKASILQCSAFLHGPTLTSVHDYWKNHNFDYMDFVSKVMSLIFNMLSRFVITFFPRSSSVQFSHSAMSDSLQPHGMQHTRPPWCTPTPAIYSNSCPLSLWCHPTISSSVVPFSFCLQSFPESGSFLMSQFFASGGQSIGISALSSVLPMNIQDWFPLGWTGWISLQFKGLSRVFTNTTVQKSQFFGTQLSF